MCELSSVFMIAGIAPLSITILVCSEVPLVMFVIAHIASYWSFGFSWNERNSINLFTTPDSIIYFFYLHYFFIFLFIFYFLFFILFFFFVLFCFFFFVFTSCTGGLFSKFFYFFLRHKNEKRIFFLYLPWDNNLLRWKIESSCIRGSSS